MQSRPAAGLRYSMRLSARIGIVSGNATPSAFAVRALIARSNSDACSTGRSPGFAPLTILSTKYALRRQRVTSLLP